MEKKKEYQELDARVISSKQRLNELANNKKQLDVKSLIRNEDLKLKMILGKQGVIWLLYSN